jgi:hypothetical protein
MIASTVYSSGYLLPPFAAVVVRTEIVSPKRRKNPG